MFEIKQRFSNIVNEDMHEKGGGPYRGFGFSSLVSDPLDMAWSRRQLVLFQYF